MAGSKCLRGTGDVGFGTLWVGGRSWPKPEMETADGELWEDRETTEGTKIGVGGWFLTLPAAIGKCPLSLLAEQFPETFPIHGTGHRPSTLTFPWCLS